MKIIRYTDKYKSQWDDLVSNSRNGTFLHLRNYMDYHSDRFEDCSLMCEDEKDRIIAVLPANISGETLYSHQGLTYGGWITDIKAVTATTMLQMWEQMVEFLRSEGVRTLIYKTIPYIYHSYPADEDIYALFRYGGQLYSTLISTAVSLQKNRLAFNENATRGIKYALKHGVIIEHTNDYSQYWDLLSSLLFEKYKTKPVHSLAEILLLKKRFPENIKLYVARKEDEIVAGAVIFFTKNVAHAQYIATSEKGRILKALPLLFDYVITNECNMCEYFDFGTSNEDSGRIINDGLIRQKTGMGGRGVAYNTFKIEL